MSSIDFSHVTVRYGRRAVVRDFDAVAEFIWDAGGVDTYKWAIQSRLGHQDEVQQRRR